MNKYNWSDKEQFLLDWKNSKNICSFLRDKGLTFTSGNYKTFQKWHNIHTSDLIGNEKENLGSYFCENSLINRNTINKKIKKLELIKYECSSCSNNGVWNGKKIVLQLEHKNGISNDNRIENLEYLCPNCHSQTKSFAGSNVHNKVFENRILNILNLKQSILSKESILELSKIWNISITSVLNWIRKYEKKLKDYNISLSETLNVKKLTNRIEEYKLLKNDEDIIEKLMFKWNLSEYRVKKIIKVFSLDNLLYINNNEKKEMRKNDILESLKNDSPLISLQDKWEISKNNVKKEIKNLGFNNLHENFKIEEVKIVNKMERIDDVLKIENKKEVLGLSKKWNTSVNGAKKWIRNNLPDKFKEIYDDKNLIKNKNKILQQEKIKYLKSLNEDFSELEAMIFLNTNKSVLYAQLKYHNPKLLDYLHSKYLCPKCEDKTRTNGKLRRCISCSYSFKPKDEQYNINQNKEKKQ